MQRLHDDFQTSGPLRRRLPINLAAYTERLKRPKIKCSYASVEPRSSWVGFKKGLPGRARRPPRGMKLRIATISHRTKLDRSFFFICERFVDAHNVDRGVLVSVHETVTSIVLSILYISIHNESSEASSELRTYSVL